MQINIKQAVETFKVSATVAATSALEAENVEKAGTRAGQSIVRSLLLAGAGLNSRQSAEEKLRVLGVIAPEKVAEKAPESKPANGGRVTA